MIPWFLIALASALSNSIYNAFAKYIVSFKFFSKTAIAFGATIIASLMLFSITFLSGFPEVDSRFWFSVAVTAVINLITLPMMLRAYEIGEFSSVYSMLLLTPVFLLFTSFIFLGETPSLLGIAGVILTVAGLYLITRTQNEADKKGNWISVLVAFLWSISTNFDKLAATYSNQFFSPAVILTIMSVGYGIYFLVKKATGNSSGVVENNSYHKRQFKAQKVILLLCLGLILGFANIIHISALLSGFVSYTIAIKRVAVLFGVFFGWLFFHEQNLGKKLLGAAIAVLGVLAIIFA